MITKKLSELQRSRQCLPPKRVAAIITRLNDHLRTIGFNSTTVGVSCKEEPIEWTAEEYENICDNITGKRLSTVHIARWRELEFMTNPQY